VTNTSVLRKKIADCGFKISFIAEKLKLSKQGFHNKLENKTEFTASEINILRDLLNIKSIKEVKAIFFAKAVDSESTDDTEGS
jgi:hypothetical protein